jgi:signal transduction histidine kinase
MIVATQDITEMALLKKELIGERQTKQNEIIDAVLTGQENERENIGKELHDNLNQILAVAKLYIQMARKNEKDREINLEKSCGFIVNVIDEIRRISKVLVLPGMHIIGLFDNIKNLLHDLALVHPIKIKFHKENIAEKDLDEKLQLTIFRIVQEQVNNILKHSKAAHASISLSRQGNEILLLISDDGKGCDIQKERKPAGIINGVGIINIKSRSELYGGSVTIISQPGAGYELKVVLLLNVLNV